MLRKVLFAVIVAFPVSLRAQTAQPPQGDQPPTTSAETKPPAPAYPILNQLFKSDLNPDQVKALGDHPSLEQQAASMTPEQRTSARAQLQEAEGKDKSADSLRQIAHGYLLLDEQEPNRGQNAVRVADQLKNLDPKNPEGWKLSAEGHYQEGDFQTATAEARQALKINPKDQNALAVYQLSSRRMSMTEPNLSGAGDFKKTAAQDAVNGPSVPPSNGSEAKSAPASSKNLYMQILPAKGLVVQDIPAPAGGHNPSQTDLDPALRYLKTSEHGREILNFMDKEGIPFTYDPALGPDVGAAFDPKSQSIHLRPDAAKTNPVQLADTIGHEGYHAEQRLGRRMEGSIEMEQGANFMDRVIYHEMLQAGAPPLPKDSVVGNNYQRFRDQVRHEDLNQFDADIEKMYSDHRSKSLDRAVKGAPGPIKGALKSGFSGVDADFLNPAFHRLVQHS